MTVSNVDYSLRGRGHVTSTFHCRIESDCRLYQIRSVCRDNNLWRSHDFSRCCERSHDFCGALFKTSG